MDPPGVPSNDRIFVLERWNGPTRTAINGKSWPYTERLNYNVGESVHWHVINASDLSHPMHLHGFHFALDAEGDGENYKVFDEGSQPMEFTHDVEIGQKVAIEAGATYVFDKGYCHFGWWQKINDDGAFFVTRAKVNCRLRSTRRRPLRKRKANGFRILDDHEVALGSKGHSRPRLAMPRTRLARCSLISTAVPSAPVARRRSSRSALAI